MFFTMIFQFNSIHFISWHLVRTIDDQCTTIGMDSFTDCLNQQHSNLVTSRRRNTKSSSGSRNSGVYTASQQAINQAAALSQWKRIMLLVSNFCHLRKARFSMSEYPFFETGDSHNGA